MPQETDKEKQLDGLTIDTAETNLTFVGLAIMSDPPRPEIYEAIKKCHRASIKIIMVTGDSSLTAKSVAVKIGLTSDKARVVTGGELDSMSKEDLKGTCWRNHFRTGRPRAEIQNRLNLARNGRDRCFYRRWCQ